MQLNLTDEQKAHIVEMAASGIVACLEFRSEKPEVIKYLDKEKHVVRWMVKHAFTCEYIGSGEPLLAELYTAKRAPVGDKDDEQEPPLPAPCGLVRGDRIIATIGGLQFHGGNQTAKVRSFVRMDGLQLSPASATAKDYTLNAPGPKKPVEK